MAQGCIAAIQVVIGHIGHQAGGAGFKNRLGMLIQVNAACQVMQALACAQLLLCLLQRQKQRIGVEFAVWGKARQGQHQNIVWAQPQLGPQPVARSFAGGEGGAIDAQWDHRHLRARGRLAKARLCIVIDQ